MNKIKKGTLKILVYVCVEVDQYGVYSNQALTSHVNVFISMSFTPSDNLLYIFMATTGNRGSDFEGWHHGMSALL